METSVTRTRPWHLVPLVWACVAANVALAGSGMASFTRVEGEAGSAPAHLQVAGDSLYFAADDGVHGNELWRIDADGQPHMVGDFWPGPEGSAPRNLIAWGDRLCFVGQRFYHPLGTTVDFVWSVDQFLSTTRCHTRSLMEQTEPGDTSVFCAEKKLIAAQSVKALGRELVLLDDGSVIDTVPGRIGGVRPAQEFFTVIDNKLLFTIQTSGVSSRELQALDLGAPNGTSDLTSLASLNSAIAFPVHCQAVNNRLWFAGSCGARGMELCVTDGTPDGTRAVRDINPGMGDSMPKDFTGHDGIVYFQADDGTHGIELWRTDGTAEGTWMVKDINRGRWNSSPYNMCSIGRYLLFAATREGEGTELWRTDGTEGGTQLVADIYPGAESSNLYQPIAHNGLLLFSAAHPRHGEELWRSDGTPEGTGLVRDIRPGAENAEPYYLTQFRNLVYFCANDGVHGEELWRTDGTREGTRLAADISPQTRITRSGNPTHLTAAGNGIAFAADDLQHGNEPWWSDAETMESRLMEDINAGPESSAPSRFTVYGDAVYFVADDGTHGRELWRFDLASRKASLVGDILDGPDASEPRLLCPTNGGLVFAATDARGEAIYCVEAAESSPKPLVSLPAEDPPARVVSLQPDGARLHVSTQDSQGTYRFAQLDLETLSLERLPYALPAVLTWEAVRKADREFGRGDAGEMPMRSYFSLSVMEGRSIRFQDRWYFAARTASQGTELWTAGTTPDSAQLFYDCMPGEASGSPSEFAAVGNELFFVAERAGTGRELWTTDGSVDGTHVVADWNGTTYRGAGPRNLVPHAQRLFYTAPGTASYGERRALTGCARGANGLLVVTASEPERWWPENPQELTPVGSWLYFSADHPATGRELWRYRAQPRAQDVLDAALFTVYTLVHDIARDPRYDGDTQVAEFIWHPAN